MKILIVPGLSSPNCAKYRPVYKLLEESACARFPGATVKTLVLPGQSNEKGEVSGEFLLPEASATVLDELSRCGCEGTVIIARSSGCNAVAHLLATHPECALPGVVLWGPPPFWLYYDMFVRDARVQVAEAAQNGVRITSRIAETATPFESILRCVTARTLICTGTMDELCPPQYAEYLKWLFRSCPHIEFSGVPTPHSVTNSTAGKDLYINAIMGWIAKTMGAGV